MLLSVHGIVLQIEQRVVRKKNDGYHFKVMSQTSITAFILEMLLLRCLFIHSTWSWRVILSRGSSFCPSTLHTDSDFHKFW